MTNETYHILGASIRAAQMGLGNGVIILLKKQTRGKTHTVKMLQRDNKPFVQRLPPGTESAMYQFLAATNPAVYFIDDKDKWDRFIYTLGLRYFKGLSDAEKAPLKMTFWNKETVTDPIPTKSWSWILFNKEQLDSCSSILVETGLMARAIIIRSGHTDIEFVRIGEYYEKHGYNETNFPFLKIHDDWFASSPRELTDADKNIINSCPEDKRRNIIKIAKAMSEKGFRNVSECILLSAAGNYFNEIIEFIDPNTDKKKS